MLLPRLLQRQREATARRIRQILDEWGIPLTHLLQFATQSGGNLLIPHKPMPPAAKS
jgi:hypothetical protein